MLTTGPRYHARQQRLTALAVRQARRNSSNLTRMLGTIAVYQATSAEMATEYGTAALEEQGVAADGERVAAAAFTLDPGTADAFDEIETRYQFDRLVATLVADAGRSAAGVFAASRREECGHIRQLTPPSCQRCAVLAGRWYRWSDGFQRHPNCDCVMMPGPRSAAAYAVDPAEAYRRGDISDLSKAQVQAIEDGADISQVVNVRRGLTEVNFMGRRLSASTEGTTVRGLASRRRTGRNLSARLTPESIYRVADDRADALRMLKLHGYIL